MLAIAVANLWAKKLRLVSTSLSVFVGVAFLAGTLMLLDTIGQTFDGLYETTNGDVDAVVRSSEVIRSDFVESRGTIDGSLVATVAGVDGVAAAEGSVQGYAQLVAPDGKAMGEPNRGTPVLGLSWGTVDALNPMDLVAGRAPTDGDEVVIDRGSARRGPFAIGDQITILPQGPPRRFTLVGIATFGSADSPLGATAALFDQATAQEVLGQPGQLDTISVLAQPLVSQESLRDRLAAVLPAGTEVITGAALIDEQQSAQAHALSFVDAFMLAFAFVALFVAAFIIYNTFAILVAQRTREMALLRALGATRLQLVASVLAEATIVAALASALGIGAGFGIASLLKWLVGAVGFDIPASGLVFRPATAYISMAAGITVTVLAALGPAWRASRVAPMVALRAPAEAPTRPRIRTLIGTALGAAGAASLSWGLFGQPSNRLPLIGLGAVAAFLGVTALGPVIATPFARFVGLPMARFGGVPGELAQENAVRNPKRTATAAAALMIGVGLVGTISIFAASVKASTNSVIDRSVAGDLIIDSGNLESGGLSPELAARISQLPEVAAVSGVRFGYAEVDGATRNLTGIDPASYGDIVDLGVTDGSLGQLGGKQIAVEQRFARRRGWTVGDTIEVRFAATGPQQLTIAAIYTHSDLVGNLVLGYPAYEANYPEVYDFQVYVMKAPGFSVADARAAVAAVASDYPSATVQDLEEYKAGQAAQVDQFLSLVYALLVLALVIALLGIANTLALSVAERTRELGLLRAVGMTRRQLRRSVRFEAVVITLLGTTMGLGVGLFFGWALVRALRDLGITEFRLPLGGIAVTVALAVLAGVAAAARPARHAARLDILDAIATDS